MSKITKTFSINTSLTQDEINKFFEIISTYREMGEEHENNLICQSLLRKIHSAVLFGKSCNLKEKKKEEVVAFSANMGKTQVRLTVWRDDLTILTRDNINDYDPNPSNLVTLKDINFESSYQG